MSPFCASKHIRFPNYWGGDHETGLPLRRDFAVVLTSCTRHDPDGEIGHSPCLGESLRGPLSQGFASFKVRCEVDLLLPRAQHTGAKSHAH